MSKAKKIVCVLITILLLASSFCLTAFAETRYKTAFLNLTKAMCYGAYSTTNNTAYQNITPVDMVSPYGGTAQGFSFSIRDEIFSGINANMYFEKFTFLANKKYTLSGKVFINKTLLEDVDGYFNLSSINLYLLDDNRDRIATLISPDDIEPRKEINWSYGVVNEGQSDSFEAGFYSFELDYIPSKNTVGYFFNLCFRSYLPDYYWKYFGLSDLVLSYEYDGTQDIIDNQNQNTQDIIDNQNSNTDKEIQAEKDMYEQEKQEAQQSGDESIDGAMENMPNDSEGIIDSFGSFIGTMLHTNTDCTIDFPALKTPAIGGLPSYTLSEKQPVNFNEFEEVIPKSILLIVRALLTIALIIFCYKELYSTIQYVVSLKKGGGD